MDDLIDRCKAGDRAALEELFRTYRHAATKMACRISGTYQDVEDMVQEAFLKVTRSISQFRGECSFSTWLYRILLNAERDKHRRSGVQFVSLDELMKSGSEVLNKLSERLSVLPHDEYERRESLYVLMSSLKSLPSLDQAALWLREVGDLSYKDISSALGCSIEAVRGRLKRARRAARDRILEMTTPPIEASNS